MAVAARSGERLSRKAEVRAEKEVVVAAVKHCAPALEFANPALRADPEVEAAVALSPTSKEYTPEMPSPTPYANLKCLGFNARERERLRVFQRLSHLTGLAEMTDPGSQEAEYTLAKQLASMVVTGGNCPDIVSARERVARLLSIAKDLLMEVQYLQDNPQEAKAIEGADEHHFEQLRKELFRLCRELEGRAGEPEPMQTLAAERMRQKLEAKLLPKFNTEIPRWAERLRFLHAEVLKWRSPDQLLDTSGACSVQDEDPKAKADAEAAAAAAAQELLDSVTRKEKPQPEVVNHAPPRPKGKELEMLKAMGWTPEDEEEDLEVFHATQHQSSSQPRPSSTHEAPSQVSGVSASASASGSTSVAAAAGAAVGAAPEGEKAGKKKKKRNRK